MARRFFTATSRSHRAAAEVITDRAPARASVIKELFTMAFHKTGQYENNRCEAGHGGIGTNQVNCPKSPQQTSRSDLRGAQALKSCNRRAIAAANSLNRKWCPSAEVSLPRNRNRPCNRRAIVRGVQRERGGSKSGCPKRKPLALQRVFLVGRVGLEPTTTGL